MEKFKLGTDHLTSAKLVAIGKKELDIELCPIAMNTVQTFRTKLTSQIDSDAAIYGVTTGFGLLSNKTIEKDKQLELQKNLVLSHACGVGEYLSEERARALFVLKMHNLMLGASGISAELIQHMFHLFELDFIPLVPIKGSVGASGDLAPLAHLGLMVIGEGKILRYGRPQDAEMAFENASISPYVLKHKEGLSLINGTQFMSVQCAFAVEQSRFLLAAANTTAALSLDGIKGSRDPFDPRLHSIRPHQAQADVAAYIYELLENDEILASHTDCDKVQDPYSFRCVPQVHGACLTTIRHVEEVLTVELNSVTDNPIVTPEGDVLSGGNFHGEPLAFVMDYLGIAMAELGSIAERRVEKLTNPVFSDLPAFLAADSGLHSGFMIPHVVAASLVSENKVLAHPASVDSIPTSADKEDHVSMGPISGQKLNGIINNLAYILAIEAMTACQAIDFLTPLQPGPQLKKFYEYIRDRVAFSHVDKSTHQDIEILQQDFLLGKVLIKPLRMVDS